jgi:hypothetical protein
VTNSSAQETFSITLNDSAMGGSDIITITSQPYYTVDNINTGQSVTLNNYNYSGSSVTGISAVELGSIDLSTFNPTTFEWISPIPFENAFPNWEDFEAMRKEYPGLEQAYEKLKTFYDLCKDEWEHKKKEQK